MPPVACTACKQKMSSDAAVCPHCGARATGAPAKIADVKLTQAEIRALISADEAKRGVEGAPRGVARTLLAPHPRTAGAARIAEVGLMIVALPLILGGLLPLIGMRRITRGRVTDVSGEAATVLTTCISGSVTLVSFLVSTSLSAGAIAVVIGVEIAALVARSAVRSRADASRELHRLARGE